MKGEFKSSYPFFFCFADFSHCFLTDRRSLSDNSSTFFRFADFFPLLIPLIFFLQVFSFYVFSGSCFCFSPPSF